jgi:hypothetical protein
MPLKLKVGLNKKNVFIRRLKNKEKKTMSTVAPGGVSPDMQASLDAQKALQKQNMLDQTAQTMFQDQKNRQNEALKAISDAVNDNYKARLDQIRNMKSQ